MPDYSAGRLFLQIVPSFRGVPEQIREEARGWAEDAGRSFDDNLGKAVGPAARKAAAKAGKEMAAELGGAGGQAGEQFSEEFVGQFNRRSKARQLFEQLNRESAAAARDAGKKTGDEYAGQFRESIKRGIASAQREVDALKVRLDDKEARKQLTALQVGLKGLEGQIKVGMDSGKAMLAFQALEQKARDLHDAASSLEFRSNIGGVIRDMEQVRSGIQSLSQLDIEPNLKIDRQLSRFQRTLKDGIANALRDIPPVEVDGDIEPAKRRIADLRRELTEIGDWSVEVDIDSASALEQLQVVENELRDLATDSPDLDVRVNAASALTTIEGVRAELLRLSTLTVEPEIRVEHQQGAFERSLKDAIGNALRDLPPVDVEMSTTKVGAAIQQIRRELLSLNDQHIGVDIDAGAAVQKLTELQLQLNKLIGQSKNIDVDANILGAVTALSAVQAMIDKLKSQGIDIDVDVESARAIAALRGVDHAAREAASGGQDAANSFRAFNGVLFGLVSVGPAVIPVLGAVAGGLAALGPLGAAGAAGIGVLALGLFGVGDAFKALGDAQTNGAQQAADHARAVRNAASSVAAAEAGVEDARRSAAQGATEAARRVEDALAGVEDAERGVRDAQRDAQRAQEDLTRAREAAREAQEDLALSVRGGALAEREAILDLREAERELAEARANNVTGDDLERYILDLDQARFNVDRVRESNADLAAEQAEMARTGIEGTDGVVAARDRLDDANRRIADAERGLIAAQREVADARAAQAQQAVEGQRQISDAQARLADAQANYNDILAQTTTSQQKVIDTMSQLGPAGQSFVNYLHSLRPVMDELRGIAQEGFLPGFQSWIDSMVGHHGPLLRDTVRGISGAVGEMFEMFGRSLRGQAFTELFEMINRSGPTFIGMMGQVLTYLGEGVANLIVAMEPLGYLFGQWLVDASATFAEWAHNLGNTSGLYEFFAYVQEVGPMVGDFFMTLADAIMNLAVALAPYAENLLGLLTNILGFIAQMPPEVLGPIATGLIGITLALQTIFGLTAMAKSFESAFHILNITMGASGRTIGGLLGPIGKLLGLFGVLAGAMVVLYQNSETFRAGWDKLYAAVQPLVSGIFDVLIDVLGFLFGLIGDNIGVIAGMAAAWGAWIVLQSVQGWLGGLDDLLGRTTIRAASLYGQLRDFAASARGPWVTAFGALAVGVLLIAGHMQEASRRGEEWAKALREGGAAAETAARQMDQVGASFSSNFDNTAWDSIKMGFNSVFNPAANLAIAGQAEALGTAARASREYWNSLSPLEQAQAKVAEWTETLSHRIETQGRNSEGARIAQERLTFWNGQLEGAQRRLEGAVSGVNIEMLEQQNLSIALAEADMAYAQSSDALAQAHQRVAEAQAAVNATAPGTEEHARAQEALAQAIAGVDSASQGAYASARRVAEARYADADASVRQAAGNAAVLAELIKQEEVYGSLPPRLQQLKDELLGTVEPSWLLTIQMQNLGTAIRETPDGKHIAVSSTTPEQIQAMRDLGFEVRELPNGEFEVIAHTDAAKEALDELTAPRHIDITAGVRRGMNRVDPNLGRIVDNVPERATGGPIWGPGTGTSDSILARVSNGEYVVRASAVRQYGVGFLDAINTQKFANGGLVGPVPRFAEGGYVATYGGTINMSGIAIPELATFWAEAVASIQEVSARAAVAISTTFLKLREAVLANAADTTMELATRWAAGMTGMATAVQLGSLGITNAFIGLQANVTKLVIQTMTQSVATWTSMALQLNAISSLLQLSQTAEFERLRANIFKLGQQTMFESVTTWTSMALQLNAIMSLLQMNQTAEFERLRANVFKLGQQTMTESVATWTSMSLQLNAISSLLQMNQTAEFERIRANSTKLAIQMSDQLNGIYTGMMTNTMNTVNALSLGMGIVFEQMRQKVIAAVDSMTTTVANIWSKLPGAMIAPVNVVIDRVFNNGLFPAFNSIVSELGLPAEWKIPASPIARLAAGGRVPGWSPNDVADNIPAMLTAGEWVQPVDAVRYYGPELMEAIRKKKIPRDQLAHYATGGMVGGQPIQHLATGGELFAIVRRQFPTARLTSSYRPGDPGYHGRNMAADIGGPTPAPSGSQIMANIEAWIAANFGGNTNELIYNGLGDRVSNLYNGRPHAYSAATQAQHRNHVHWAVAGAVGGGGVVVDAGTGAIVPMYPEWYTKYNGDPQNVLNVLQNSITGANAALGMYPPSAYREVLNAIPKKAVEAIWSKAGPVIGQKFTDAASAALSAAVGAVAPTSMVRGAVVDAVRAVAGGYGWDSGNEWNSLSRLIQKESSWNPNAQNPTSTAYGLFQFLNGTWGGTGVAKTSDPRQQAIAGLRYISGRYGTPSRALAFHNANNWYSEGGPVANADGSVTPELHDSGGVLHPGLNILMNKTRKPEVSLPITPEQLESMVNGAGAAGPMIGEINLPLMTQATPVEVAGEILHQWTVASRGGRY